MTGRDAKKEPAKLPEAKALPVVDLVDYAEGAIVSRIVSKTDTGTITLFAFDAGQELSEHSAPFDAFVHIVEGEAELTIGGEPVTAGEGRLVLMPADVPHAVKATTRFKMLLTMLRSA